MVHGSSTINNIVVEKGVTATVTLNSVNITGRAYDNVSASSFASSPIDLSEGSTVTLILEDKSKNVLTGGAGGMSSGAPGIHVPESAALIIQGKGTLSVSGGSSSIGYGGAGIGGKVGGYLSTGGGPGENCGTVIILSENANTLGGISSSGNGIDIGGGLGNTNGHNGQGIRPSGNKRYTAWGNLTLPTNIAIPENTILDIAAGTALNTAGKLTNNGEIIVAESTEQLDAGKITGKVNGRPVHQPTTGYGYNSDFHYTPCAVPDCDAKPDGSRLHEHFRKQGHNYIQEDINEAHKANDASCTSPVTYYKSCQCGKNGTDTFRSGSAAGHSWGTWSKNVSADTHTRTCTVCQQTETKNCSGGTATCTEKATCGVCGSRYGNLDFSKHSGNLIWKQTDATHQQIYGCCNTPVGYLSTQGRRSHLHDFGRLRNLRQILWKR